MAFSSTMAPISAFALGDADQQGGTLPIGTCTAFVNFTIFPGFFDTVVNLKGSSGNIGHAGGSRFFLQGVLSEQLTIAEFLDLETCGLKDIENIMEDGADGPIETDDYYGFSFRATEVSNGRTYDYEAAIKGVANSERLMTKNEVVPTDSTPPTASISPFTGPFSGNFRAAITLSEASTDFSVEDLTVTNGTVTLTGSGTAYEATMTPAADGNITLQVKAGSFSDAAGNMNTGTSNTITINADLTPPTATIADFVGPDANGRYTAAITLSESSNVFVGEGQKAASFTVDDLEVTNGTVTLVQIDKTVSFSATVTPGDGSEIALQVKAGSFSDEAGNLNAEASNRVTLAFDATPPTISLSEFTGPVDGKLKTTVTLSEPSTDFTVDDFLVRNGTVSMTGSGTTYEAAVTPDAEGFVTLQVNPNKFSDAAGNFNDRPSNRISKTFDATPPTATIQEFRGPEKNGVYTAVVILSEPAFRTGGDGEQTSTFTVEDLEVVNGTVTLSGRATGQRFTAAVTPTGGAEISLQVKAGSFSDTSGNVNVEASNIVKVNTDTTPPTATISPFTGPVDGKFRAAITLSEASTDFTAADLNVTNGTATLSGSGTTYEATLTPTADGDISLQIKAGSFSDAAGNVNTDVSNTITATFDSTPPTATIAAFVGPTDGKYTAAITLSEDAIEFVGEGQQVSSLTVDDLTVANGTVVLTGGGKSFTATVTPSDDGEITLQVKVNSFQDAAGNKNDKASNTVKVTFDGTPPTAVIAALEGPTEGKFTAAITLSESADDFTVDDLMLTNSTATLTGSGTAYIVTLTPIEDGEIAALIKVGSFTDAAGNVNAEASNRAAADYAFLRISSLLRVRRLRSYGMTGTAMAFVSETNHLKRMWN